MIAQFAAYEPPQTVNFDEDKENAKSEQAKAEQAQPVGFENSIPAGLDGRREPGRG